MSKKGFTLIELLIVIVIIGILSVAVVPRVLDYPKKARDAVRKQTMTALQTAMASYLIDNPSVPPATVVSSCLNDGGENLGSLLKSTLPNNALPVDPKVETSKYGQAAGCLNYYYVLDKDATSGVVKGYGFMAAMETGSGNVIPATDFSVSTILGLNPNLSTGTYYLLKQTGL